MVIGVTLFINTKKINWADYKQAFPAFVLVIMIPFTYNILFGILWGYICYFIIGLFTGDVWHGLKDVVLELSPPLYFSLFKYIEYDDLKNALDHLNNRFVFSNFCKYLWDELFNFDDKDASEEPFGFTARYHETPLKDEDEESVDMEDFRYFLTENTYVPVIAGRGRASTVSMLFETVDEVDETDRPAESTLLTPLSPDNSPAKRRAFSLYSWFDRKKQQKMDPSLLIPSFQPPSAEGDPVVPAADVVVRKEKLKHRMSLASKMDMNKDFEDYIATSVIVEGDEDPSLDATVRNNTQNNRNLSAVLEKYDGKQNLDTKKNRRRLNFHFNPITEDGNSEYDNDQAAFDNQQVAAKMQKKRISWLADVLQTDP